MPDSLHMATNCNDVSRSLSGMVKHVSSCKGFNGNSLINVLKLVHERVTLILQCICYNGNHS